MESQKTYKLAPGILAKAERIGINGDTAEVDILRMAKLAARVTHPDATHRFRQYILTIDADGLVTTLDRMDATEDEYYTHRKYDDRRADQEEVPTPLGEAIVTRKNK
jgi:hypothetical protein